MKIDIFQRKISAFSTITEIYMVEYNISILDFYSRVFLILHFRNFLQNLCNTICGSLCDHDHDKHKGYHGKGHQNLKGIYDHTCQLTCCHASKNNTFSSDGNKKKHHCIHGKLHHRSVPCNNLLCLCEKIIYIFRNTVEFINLMVFPYKSFYHTGGIYIFLNRIIQNIILVEYLDKMRMGFFCNKNKRSSEKRDYD